MLRLDDDGIRERLSAAIEVLRDGRPILSRVDHTRGGPYALFHHLSHAMERVQDVGVIFDRMVDERTDLSELWATMVRPPNWPPGVPYEEPYASQVATQSRLTKLLKVDYESLFHFGSVLLDQWAYASGYLAGVATPEDFTFHKLSLEVQGSNVPPALAPIRHGLLRHVRWLYFWMRTYRNAFVVHANRPWQRGVVSTVRGDDFSLHTPSPAGWENEEGLHAELLGLRPLAPERIQSASPDSWERTNSKALLAAVIENIGQVDRQADRDRIAYLAGRAGTQTPTFQVVVGVLADFISQAAVGVQNAALAQPESINLGASGRGA